MNALINRRRMMAQSATAAVAAVAMPAAALAASGGNPDAEVLAIVAELAALQVKLKDGYRRSKDAHDRAMALNPPLPEKARQRPSDVATYGLPPPRDRDGNGFYTTFDTHELSSFHPSQPYKVRLDEFVRTRPDPGVDLFLILRTGEHEEITLHRTWPEARARADEIVASLEAWKVERELVLDGTGYSAIEAELEALQDQESELLDGLVAAPARTMAGVIAKARALTMLYDRDEQIELGESTDCELAASLIGDMLAIETSA